MEMAIRYRPRDPTVDVATDGGHRSVQRRKRTNALTRPTNAVRTVTTATTSVGGTAEKPLSWSRNSAILRCTPTTSTTAAVVAADPSAVINQDCNRALTTTRGA
jgi:hypothetical protein